MHTIIEELTYDTDRLAFITVALAAVVIVAVITKERTK